MLGADAGEWFRTGKTIRDGFISTCVFRVFRVFRQHSLTPGIHIYLTMFKFKIEAMTGFAHEMEDGTK